MYNFVDDSIERVVAFDFDNTINADPEFFLQLMEMFEKRGWHVIVVTYRQYNCYPEDLDFLVRKGYTVYFTGQTAKLDYMMEQVGLIPTLWIDDDPQSIVLNYNPLKGVYYKAQITKESVDTDK